ncbi:topoisomerase DNA-binding C4 zinc finger domain-containing protein [candidate division KSB1 bacterium]|nr:topoisomerase DNA-binding C4 zinc finger domain-containing protein [candidate division KSB1 bacterium]
MAKSIILVESQQKLRTLQSYVADDHHIVNMNGAIEDAGTEYLRHLLFNQPAELAFLSDSKIASLSQIIRDSETVLLATSPDYTGDALARQIVNALHLKDKDVHRLFLQAISKREVIKAIGEKRNIPAGSGALLEKSFGVDSAFNDYFRDLINSKKIKKPIFSLAAALALRKIYENDAAMASRTSTLASSLCILFKRHGRSFTARLSKINGQTPSIANSHAAKAIIFDLKEQKYKIDRLSDSTITTAPPLPFTTAKLIAAAETHLGFSPRQTCSIARSLYNGCDIGQKKPVGLITYPITDSLFIPEQDLLSAREFIMVNYGKAYVPEKPRLYSDASYSAFSVIRPTAPSRTPKKLKKHLADGPFQLYDLIWKRFLASQMTDSTMAHRKVYITAGPQKAYVFRLEQIQTMGRGYLQLFPQTENQTSFLFSQEWQKNGEIIPCDYKYVVEQHKSDFYYTEGRLLEALGDLDVCMIETLEYIPDILREWKFVRQTADGKLYPTRPGKTACELLQRRYPDILNERFIRQQKAKLFMLENGKKNIDPVAEITKLLQHPARPTMEDQAADGAVKKTNSKCPVCGGSMLQKSSSSGDYMVCEFYPDNCQYSKSIHPHLHRYYGRCDDCHAELTVKIGRYGRFLACSAFPKCKFTRPFPTGAKCPREGCEGDVIERITKTGRLFYGCSLFPHCKFSSWQMPVNIACPKCGNLYLTLKNSDAFDVYQCPKCKTEFDANLAEK